MLIVATVIQVVLCVFFLFTGFKIISGQMADEFKRFGFPPIFNVLTGLFELVGAVGMVVGIWIPVIAFWAGLLLGGTMLAAAFTLIAVARDPYYKAIPAIVLFILSLSVSILHLF